MNIVETGVSTVEIRVSWAPRALEVGRGRHPELSSEGVHPWLQGAVEAHLARSARLRLSLANALVDDGLFGEDEEPTTLYYGFPSRTVDAIDAAVDLDSKQTLRPCDRSSFVQQAAMTAICAEDLASAGSASR